MKSTETILITGGAGFIGSALIRFLINNTCKNVVNLDKLTYAGNLDSLDSVIDNDKYNFERIDICDSEDVGNCINKYRPEIIIHLAAESHVDRSIDGPIDFIQTNIVGTTILLEQSRKYYNKLSRESKSKFRFHHVSTDEVYGDLPHPDDDPNFSEGNLPLFTEKTSYAPSSPYSSSKASSDHLVRAWYKTYGLPTIITNCSNNYGPYQFPEKLIPLIILNAIEQKFLPVYGNGKQIRDWLYVEDHVCSLYRVATEGRIGETYNIGGNNEISNIDVVYMICDILDNLKPPKSQTISSYRELIRYVDDRPGHDRRYAINASKIKEELNWSPVETFASGLLKTIHWYLNNLSWCKNVQEGSYRRQRIGLI